MQPCHWLLKHVVIWVSYNHCPCDQPSGSTNPRDMSEGEDCVLCQLCPGRQAFEMRKCSAIPQERGTEALHSAKAHLPSVTGQCTRKYFTMCLCASLVGVSCYRASTTCSVTDLLFLTCLLCVRHLREVLHFPQNSSDKHNIVLKQKEKMPH